MNTAKKFCIIGTPVGHSRSPELYRRIFDERGYAGYTYEINEIKTNEEFDSFIADMREGLWDGCNVTMPWKTAAAETMDVLLDNASLTGAVNTVVRRCGVLYGDSTDGGGMCDAIISDTGISLKKKTVVILGCGGAARSIIAELALRQAGRISIFCRPGKNMDLTSVLIDKIENRFNSDFLPDAEDSSEDKASDGNGSDADLYTGRGAAAVKDNNGFGSRSVSNGAILIDLCDYDDTQALEGSIREADILINCTPVGMAPDTDRLPVPDTMTFPEDLIVADAVYNPDETLLIRKARADNCRTVKGIRMLELQAERASMLFLK